MLFAVSKIVLFLILPPSGLLLLMCAGLIVMRRYRTMGRALVAAGIILLVLLSLPVVSNRLIRPLEAAYPPYYVTVENIDAVVVLGGGARDLAWVPASPAPSEHSLVRLAAAVPLALELSVPLVISGGSGEIAPGGAREADTMAASAVELGFPRRDLILENSSRNTWENAEALKGLLLGRTIVLVTSAYHMRRSVMMFRKQGFTVLPAPTGYKSQSGPFSIASLIPRADALNVSSTAISEYLSIVWYTVTGRL